MTHDKLIIHIGLRKTGSSALQDLLARETDLLASHGIVYPDRLFDYPAHQELAWALMDPLPSYVPANFDSTTVFDHYADVIEKNVEAGVTTLLSAEDLSFHRDSAPALNDLKELFGKYAPKIVIYHRNPISYHVSNYKHRVFEGRETGSFIDYVMNLNQLAYPSLEFHREAWARVFGRDNVLCLEYKSGALKTKGILATFVKDVFGIEIEDTHINYTSNRSVSNAATQYLLELNRSDLPDAELKAFKWKMYEVDVRSSEADFLNEHLTEHELHLLKKIYKLK